jgi:hypothetical protein
LTTWNGRVPAFRIAANVRGGGRETTETLHQGQQGADDDEAEQHVKQQLLVRPLRAVGRHAELGAGGGVEQAVEVGCYPLQLGVDVASVHRHSIVCGACPTVTVASNQRSGTSTDLPD